MSVYVHICVCLRELVCVCVCEPVRAVRCRQTYIEKRKLCAPNYGEGVICEKDM